MYIIRIDFEGDGYVGAGSKPAHLARIDHVGVNSKPARNVHWPIGFYRIRERRGRFQTCPKEYEEYV